VYELDSIVFSICVAAVAIAWFGFSKLSDWLTIRERHLTIRARGYPPPYCDTDGDTNSDYWDQLETMNDEDRREAWPKLAVKDGELQPASVPYPWGELRPYVTGEAKPMGYGIDPKAGDKIFSSTMIADDYGAMPRPCPQAAVGSTDHCADSRECRAPCGDLYRAAERV
jgi:hypothetical protein